MKLLADSGSTKTEWVLLNGNQKVLHTYTMGLNPYHINETILNNAIVNSELNKYLNKVKIIEFYGAGCSNTEKAVWLKNALQKHFSNATIAIHTDIEAAVLATYQKLPCTVCILGTGSTFRMYDGKQIISKYSSLSYILGDEGSGTYIAKTLLKGIFYQNLSTEIRDAFFEDYAIDSSILLEKIYSQPLANRYLASFVPFCKKHIDKPEIETIVLNAFEDFFNQHLVKYNFAKENPVHFVGSIAFHFKEQLEKTASKLKFKTGSIIKNPLPYLIEKSE